MTDEKQLISEMTNILFADVHRCDQNLQAENTSFQRRTYVRAAFCAIEGVTSFLKFLALKKARETTPHDVARISALSGLRYSVNDKGQVEEQTLFTTLEITILHSFREYTQAVESQFVLDKNAKEWAALKEAIKVRNRITHPKTLADLDVSERDLTSVTTAYAWICTKALFDLLTQSRNVKAK